MPQRARSRPRSRFRGRQVTARTDATRTDERVRESEERYRQASARLEVILESMADGITVRDPTGRLVYVNDAAARLFGVSHTGDLLEGEADAIAARFEMRDEVGQPVDATAAPRVLEGARSVPPRLLHVRDRSTGRQWWTLVRTGVIPGASNVPDLAVDIWHDVTIERRREEAARYLVEATAVMSESLDYASTMGRLARLLVPALADWCAVDVVEGNELKNLAIAQADPSNHELTRGLGPDNAGRLSEPHGARKVVLTGRAQLFADMPDDFPGADGPSGPITTGLRAMGLRSALLVPLTAHGTTLGVMTLLSVESGRRYDHEDMALAGELGWRAGIAIENARAYREARDAIRLREEFLSIAGHELKTPLTALLLQLQSVSAAFASGTVTQNVTRWGERASKALGQARRLERLVNELLDVSRVTLGRMILDREGEMDLAALVHEVVERHSAELARSGSTLTVRHANRTAGYWDRSRLDQVVTNLLSNALKYGGGKPIDVSILGGPHTVRLVVEDRGIGIRPEDQSRIFGRFERAVSERHYGGFGLGLWIVRELVEAHGGQVGFESVHGAGSTFVAELPYVPPAESTADAT